VLMLALPLETWLRFFVWLCIGLVIYGLFGRKHSVLESGEEPLASPAVIP
jgi:APA family basic amino acid/polyamine antiporter